MKNMFYIHSMCCGSHWNIFIDGKDLKLVCDKCEKSAGSGIVVKSKKEHKGKGYLLSPCCGSSWEFVTLKGKFYVECGNCHARFDDVEIIGPNMKKCDCCKKIE